MEIDSIPWLKNPNNWIQLPWSWCNDIGEEEDISKVIFLDIDGVLNDDDYTGIKVHEDKVKLLAKLVNATDADIVISSSWRYYIRQYILRISEGEEIPPDMAPVRLLTSLFERYNLKISGFTPELSSGPDARPMEIRAWLINQINIDSFVILDDDNFWTWKWMDRYFIRTATKQPGRNELGRHRDEVRGLTEAHVQKAIEILNSKIQKEEKEA